MFDEIRCEVPLPDGEDSGDIWFQTKSFPAPCMQRYAITSEGRLVDSRGNDLEPDGYVQFYTAAPASGLREYRAEFHRGDLITITVGNTAEQRFFGLASVRWFDAPSFLFSEPETGSDETAVPRSEPPAVTETSEREALLLTAIQSAMPKLKRLLEEADGHWQYEDPVYRLYHMSFKVFHLQRFTGEIVAELGRLLPGVPLNEIFLTIVRDGSNRRFTAESNGRWLPETRPIVEAFFHARFFLEMAVRYGQKLDAPPKTLPSGYAALLCLYNLR